jgi:uncharacterized protein (TIGR01777 family)
MRVFITGASGLLGGRLIERLLARGDQVLALSRRAPADGARPGPTWIEGDVSVAGAWQQRLDGSDAVVHLAGEPLSGKRWTDRQKERIVHSRVAGTRNVAAAIAAAAARPRVLVSASGVHVYGARGEEELEESAAPGTGFLADLCRSWEEEAGRAAGARVACLRMGVVLSPHGGAMDKLRPAFALFVGGPLGDPRAWFPWIHEEDAVGLLLHGIDGGLAGPVNGVAPGNVRMGDFARALGRALRRPALLPVPALALRLLLGEMASVINPGLKVVPRAALAAGYRFRHPTIDGALSALFSRG